MTKITLDRAVLEQALEALERTVDCGHDAHECANVRAITALRAALAEPQEPVAWTPVTEAMPKSGVKVLACYRNRLGNLRRIRAMWTAAKTEEASSEDAEACSEYDEATDTYYVTEGWYECIDNWGDYSSVAVTEGEVTHWMPLPPDPDSAPPQRPAEPVQEPDISRCPKCNGPADNGHDREVPPNLYVCTKCMAEPVQEPVQEALTIERLRDALVASRIVPPAAVEDPDEYDDGVTLHRIEALHRRLA